MQNLAYEQIDYIMTLVNTGIIQQEKLISQVQEQLKLMPEGSLSKKTIKGNEYYYHVTRDTNGKLVQRLIKANEGGLKKSMILKNCLKSSLENLKNNIPIMKKFVEQYRPVNDVAYSEFSKWSAELMFEKDEKIRKWKNESFRSNPVLKENLIHKTGQGLRVRSKSEAIIAGMLEAGRIPYRYEAELMLGDTAFYPDFTILSPTSGKVLYWEHFGMMNDKKYKKKAVKKLNSYFDVGLYPCDNLVITFDKEDGSIDAGVIQSSIDLVVNS